MPATRSSRRLPLVLAVLLSGSAAGAWAQGASPAAQAGRAKAQMCATCHGPLGLASAPDAPNLAGQSEIYLAAQLRAYRSGARRHEVMAVMAKALSDEDIANLAAWYASIKVEAREP